MKSFILAATTLERSADIIAEFEMIVLAFTISVFG
jgi:hypothetical protein